MVKTVIRFKVWIEKDCKPLIGKGGYEILKAIDQYGSIAKASEVLGMSYKFIWSYIKRLEENLGESVVEMKRGGRGKGGTWLTPAGRNLLETYEMAESVVREALLEVGDLVIACNEPAVKVNDVVKSLLAGCI